MEKYKHILTRLGFTSYESSVYLSLLANGAKNISDIARDTGHHRPLVYKIIRTLREQGYIITVPSKEKRTLYYVSDPKLLLIALEDIERQSRPLIEELGHIYHLRGDRPKLSIREWVEEIRSIHGDLVSSLPKGWAYYRYSSTQRDYADRSRYVPENYFDLQKEKWLSRYIITSEKMKEKRSGNPLRDVVAIPEGFDLFDDNITKLIYADKVAIIDYDTESGWVIESPRFAEYEKKIFTLLFKLLKKKEY
jgi:sugar-specific transcriptional regulator TrmB